MTRKEKIDVLEDAICFIEHHMGSSDCDCSYVGSDDDTVNGLNQILEEVKNEKDN